MNISEDQVYAAECVALQIAFALGFTNVSCRTSTYGSAHREEIAHLPNVPSSLSHLRLKLKLGDLAAAAVAPWLALLLRDLYYFGENEAGPFLVYAGLALVASGGALAYFGVGQIISSCVSRGDLKRILKAAAAASALTAVLMFSFNRLDGIPRSMPLLHFLALGALLAGGRLARGEYRRASHSSEARAGWNYENVILVGANDLASLYLRMLGTIKGSPPRTRVLALLDERKRLHGRAIDGHIVLGGIERAKPLIAEYASHGVEVTKVLVALADPAARKAVAESLEASCGDLVRIEFLVERLGLEAPAEADADADFADFSDGSASGPTTTYWKARRVCDIFLAAIAIVVLAPLFVLTALLVWLDVGSPTLFWQERVGRGGRKILVHKFRTLKSLVDRSGRVLAEDERLSSIGRFLRNTRLDELPQLVDILRGDMSIVGPRPLLPVDLPEDASVRLSVRPGLTGWAQVHGGKRISAQEKNALDVWYIKHASFALDVRILFLTVMIMLGGDKRDDAVINQAMNNVADNGSGGVRAPETAAT